MIPYQPPLLPCQPPVATAQRRVSGSRHRVLQITFCSELVGEYWQACDSFPEEVGSSGLDPSGLDPNRRWVCSCGLNAFPYLRSIRLVPDWAITSEPFIGYKEPGIQR